MVSIVVAHLLNYKIVMAEKQKGGCCSFIHKHLTPAPKPYSSICIVLSYVLICKPFKGVMGLSRHLLDHNRYFFYSCRVMRKEGRRVLYYIYYAYFISHFSIGTLWKFLWNLLKLLLCCIAYRGFRTFYLYRSRGKIMHIKSELGTIVD